MTFWRGFDIRLLVRESLSIKASIAKAAIRISALLLPVLLAQNASATSAEDFANFSRLKITKDPIHRGHFVEQYMSNLLVPERAPRRARWLDIV